MTRNGFGGCPNEAANEDIFLTMEGVANWAAYKSTDGDLDLIRRGGRVWSQDEGLAAFLVLDAFLPGWQSRVFAENPPPLIQLLEEASRVESCHDPSEAP